MYLLSALAREAEARLDECLAARGTSRTHQEVLTVLALAGPHGRSDLAQRADGAPAATVDAVVDALLAQGLVQLVAVHVGGERQEVVMMTRAGEAALDEMHQDAEQVQNSLMMSLTRGDRVQLGSLLRRMHAMVGRQETFGSSPSVSRKVRGRGLGGSAAGPRDQAARVPAQQGRVTAGQQADQQAGESSVGGQPAEDGRDS
ncbi:MarR family winged helix-turn-helix transcriptional regulator [Streptomyces sp. TLI_171]|uniref:MarR family winged helix-turn-helix transcriptional regulator n=1 Tax=Streptomyces sp. TLI_171 TaxID=1938859 RepID=UPI000C17792A|nr:MarR family winged helix-turn-helix transcriptional regulator [Streptomyces sp. TLI_171]RKE17222.1 DNA-binding MarR family transcriptional regulator [Streptomyces sp. TLI_171]